MGANYLKLGTYNALCQFCGFKYKADQLRKRWDGLWVCNDDYETRHPQDLIRVPRESGPIPWSSPEPADVFLDGDGGTCTFEGSLALADQGTSDCARADIGA